MTKRCKVVTAWERVGNVNEMQVALNYPATWTDVTGQRDEYILRGVTALVAAGERLSDAQMTALLADVRYVVLTSGDEGAEPPAPTELTPQQITKLQTDLSAHYAPDVTKLVTTEVWPRNMYSVASALVTVNRYAPWRAGIDVAVGAVYYHDGNLYEVIQSHQTQADWTPVVAKALFKRFYEPSDDPWPWVQPTGAHDRYRLGARVLHGGFVWRSENDANVWEPGSVGAEALWTNLTPPPPTSAWKAGTAYKVNDEVTYGGFTYRCRQAHTSIVTWEPPNVPALWLKL